MSAGEPPSPAGRPTGPAAAGAGWEAAGAGAVRSGVCGSILKGEARERGRTEGGVSGPCQAGGRGERERGGGEGAGEEARRVPRGRGDRRACPLRGRPRAGRAGASTAGPRRRCSSGSPRTHLLNYKNMLVAWSTETAEPWRAARAAAQRPSTGAPSEDNARLSLAQQSVAC
jgi:hypothetical protein